MHSENSNPESPPTLAPPAEGYGFPIVSNQLRQLEDMAVTDEAYTLEMAAAVKASAEAFISVGDYASQQSITYENQQLLFNWSRQAMLYVRLWRDSLLENKKARILHQLQLRSEEQLASLQERSIARLRAALQDWEDGFQTALKLPEAEQKKLLFRWSRENAPWSIYRDQLNKLISQTDELATAPTDQLAIARQLEEIRGLLASNADLQLQRVEQQLKQLKQLIAIIEEVRSDEHPRSNRITKFITEIEGQFAGLQHEGDLRMELGEAILLLPQQDRIYIGSEAGMLQYKDINYRVRVQQWIDSEILPILYETWEETERTEAQLLLALANVRNRLTAQDQLMREKTDTEQEEVSMIIPADLETPLINFLQRAERIILSLEGYIGPLKEKLSEELRFERIYDNAVGFLPRTALQARLRNLQGAQTAIWTRFRQWLGRQQGKLLGWVDRAKREDQLSLSEKVVRAVSSRNQQPRCPAYSNIFITRGYVGESFFAGREAQLDRMEQLVKSWDEGYRGAVVLTGRRQAGKSLFGELTTNRFFAAKVIRLRPNQVLDVKGRKLEIGYELRLALDFIKKHTINEKVAIWIDDLELWWNNQQQLGENVEQLQRFIDEESQKFFFLVSCGTAMFHRLDRVYGLDKTFQARIQLGRVTQADLAQAIFIRHGATHESLKLADGEEATDADFRKLCRQVHRAADGNIGDALRLWAAGICEHPAGGVKANFPPVYGLPPFLEPDIALLLSTLIRKRRADEYHLRQLFGPGFPDRFRNVLRRLQGVGLLKRLENGQLEVEMVIANEVGQLLQRNGYITYDK
ncbi:MAG: hypothetical protein AAF433_18705 [Bacteroidota bacterium]